MYTIIDTNEYTETTISSDIFGLNFVLNHDSEFFDLGPMADLLDKLNPGNLRYPGGSVTEKMFAEVDYTDQNWIGSFWSSIQNDLTQRESASMFVDTAALTGASIQLLLPTRIAFLQTAGQALANGTYGDRREIHPEYFSLLKEYIKEFIELAASAGTEVTQLEIGNEFWGSGQMTASEYGFLAATVTEFLSDEYPELKVIAQVSYVAGQYSPLTDTSIYLKQDGSNYDVYFQSQNLSEIEGLVEYIMPGQGSGVGQTQAIAEAFTENPIALAALDGIADHVYFRRGFSGIDGERNHALRTIPQIFRDTSGLEGINTYITEWSVRNRAGNRESEGTNHLGLQYASSTLEAFYELAESEVYGANFWPLTFGNENVDRRVLIDTSERDLTFGGQVFRLLANNVTGLAPIFDFEIADEIDVHGFSNTEELIFFVSERSGFHSTTSVDFREFSTSDRFFYSIEYLGEDGITGTDIRSNPVITYSLGNWSNDTIVELDLQAWSLAMIKVQYITSSHDIIEGSVWGDLISGEDGDDILLGMSGDDTLNGNFGNDTLEGGEGNDVLSGGWGDDSLSGGLGDDTIRANFGDNTIEGGLGNDHIISSTGRDHIFSGEGSDNVEVKGGGNLIIAGTGDDVITLAQNSTAWGPGYTAFNAGSPLLTGTGSRLDVAGLLRNENVVLGGGGSDTVRLSDHNDAFFLDDQLSDFHSALNVSPNQINGNAIPRFSSIESILAGAGNDLIDLTSRRFGLAGEEIDINGGDGNDTIWGSDADETIIGGAGDDILFSGTGSDILVGGSGSDVFEFVISRTSDTIGDFNPAEGDLIRIYGSKDASNIVIGWASGELKLDFYFGSDVLTFSANVVFDDSLVDTTFMSESWSDFILVY